MSQQSNTGLDIHVTDKEGNYVWQNIYHENIYYIFIFNYLLVIKVKPTSSDVFFFSCFLECCWKYSFIFSCLVKDASQ